MRITKDEGDDDTEDEDKDDESGIWQLFVRKGNEGIITHTALLRTNTFKRVSQQAFGFLSFKQ